MKPLIKNFASFVIKILVSSLLFYLLFKNFEKEELFLILQSIKPSVLFPSLILMFLGFIPATMRWQVILGNGFSFKNLFFLNIGSFFFGTVLPGFVFGDVYRIFAGENTRLFFDSVLLDRGISFFFISFIGLILSISTTQLPIYLKVILLLLTIFFSVFLIPLLNFHSIEKLKVRLFPTIKIGMKEFSLIFFYSILFHFLGLMIWLLIGRSVDLKIPLSILITYYSILQPVSFIPFTFQGTGLREMVLVYFSKITSHSPQKLLMMGLLITSLIFITSFLCGIITGYRWLKSYFIYPQPK